MCKQFVQKPSKHTERIRVKPVHAHAEPVLLSCWDSVLLPCSNVESWPSRLRCRVFVATHAQTTRVKTGRVHNRHNKRVIAFVSAPFVQRPFVYNTAKTRGGHSRLRVAAHQTTAASAGKDEGAGSLADSALERGTQQAKRGYTPDGGCLGRQRRRQCR